MYTGLFPIRGLASSFYQLAMVFFSHTSLGGVA